MSISGYPDNCASNEKLLELVNSVFKRAAFVVDRSIETKLGKTSMKCVTLASLAIAIRAQTGRNFTNAQLTERLNEIGIDVYTAYRGLSPMKVIINPNTVRSKEVHQLAA